MAVSIIARHTGSLDKRGYQLNERRITKLEPHEMVALAADEKAHGKRMMSEVVTAETAPIITSGAGRRIGSHGGMALRERMEARLKELHTAKQYVAKLTKKPFEEASVFDFVLALAKKYKVPLYGGVLSGFHRVWPAVANPEE